MSNQSDIQHGRQCRFNIRMHWVFVEKYRRRVFDVHAIEALRGIFASVCSDAQATLVEMDGDDDHVRLLVEYSPKVAVSSLVNRLNGISSRLLHQQRPDIRTRYCKGVLWSPSYFAASCGGATISIIARTPVTVPCLQRLPRSSICCAACRPRTHRYRTARACKGWHRPRQQLHR